MSLLDAARMTNASAAVAAPLGGDAKPVVSTRRILIGAMLAAVGFACVAWAPAFTVLTLLIATGCVYEFAGLSARKGPQIDVPVAMAAVWAYILLAHFGLIHHYEGILLAGTVILALATATFTGDAGSLSRSGYTLLCVLYIGKLLTYFIAIRSVHDGALLTTWAIVLVAFTDIFAMLVGTQFGRHQLTRVSPKKTVEGALGGFAASVLAGAAIAVVPTVHISWWQGAIVGAIVSIAAQAGDLVESGLKREANVKDAGSLISGHGGVLDRFDSYLFAGIAFYFALFVIGVVSNGRLLTS